MFVFSGVFFLFYVRKGKTKKLVFILKCTVLKIEFSHFRTGDLTASENDINMIMIC